MAKRPGRINLSDLIEGPESEAPAAAAAHLPSAALAPAELDIIDTAGRTPSKLEQAAGVVPFVIHLKPEDKRRLAILSAETGLKFQHIGVAALTMWLNARGLPGLDPSTKASVPDGRKSKK